MLNTEWNDERLQRAIKGSDQDRKRALRHIYSKLDWRALAIKYVTSKGGNQQDGEDVFQDAIVLFDRNLRKGRFEGRSTLRTYFISIVKWRWWELFRKRRPEQELTDQDVDGIAQDADYYLISGEKKHFLQEALRLQGPRCHQVLMLYGLSHTMQEIAAAVGLSSAEMAKKEAYLCRKKLKKFFGDNPHWKTLVK